MVSKICCIGAGYVGGPTMAVIANECPQIKVVVVDQDKNKIKSWNIKSLNKLPIYEPGLKDLIENTRNKNLYFSEDIDKAIEDSDMIFVAVNTPTKRKGKGRGFAADLTSVEVCAKRIAQKSKNNKIVIEKSTLPVRTAEKIKEVLKKFNKKNDFEVISNPEFLAEGTAIENLYKSDRVLIGGENTDSGNKAVNELVEIYKNWIPESKILKTNVWSSELAKLASNAMLAQRISSINSFSAICEKTGASIQEISRAIGMDTRIGPKFLESSVGFGGSCFKKDILNLVYLARFYKLNDIADYWLNVIKINSFQMVRFAENIIKYIKENKTNKVVSILGWAFKSNTNDSRESPSIYVSSYLLEKGIEIKIYDPMVPEERIISDLNNHFILNGLKLNQVNKLLKKVQIYKSLKNSVNDSPLIAIITKWEEFQKFDWDLYMKHRKNKPFLFDGVNVIKSKSIKKLYSLGN